MVGPLPALLVHPLPPVPPPASTDTYSVRSRLRPSPGGYSVQSSTSSFANCSICVPLGRCERLNRTSRVPEQADHKPDQEDNEQDFGDRCRDSSDSEEAQKTGDQGDNQEH